jgi:hypothetical protein
MKRILILLSIAAFLLSCSISRVDQDWKVYKHPKGWHLADPVTAQFGKWPDIFQMQVKFDSTCKYVFYTSTGAIAENQYDYNKAGGWSFDELSAQKNSCMMGWRYGIESRKIELTFYHHSKGVAIHHTDPVQAIGFNQVATYTMIPNYSTGEIYETIEVDGVTAGNSFNMPEITNRKNQIGREINCWFGGQEKAPHKMYILKKRIK